VKSLLAVLLLVLVDAQVEAQLLTDSFNGVSLDTNIWNVFEPSTTAGGGVGSVTLSSGAVVLNSRGTLTTKQDFPFGLDIYGRFRFDGTTDRFMVWTRTTGASTNPWSDRDNGIYFRFQQNSSSIGIAEWSVGGISNLTGPYINDPSVYHNELGTVGANLPSRTWLEFRIKDTGNQVELYLGDLLNPKIIATSTFSPGSRVSFNNGYNPGQTVSIDNVTISVPEPSSFSLLAGGAVLMAGRRRRV
jgi:hypothetical protein